MIKYRQDADKNGEREKAPMEEEQLSSVHREMKEGNGENES